MPIDMKEQIADAARRLIMDKDVDKLTVKNIVNECHITRQTFYYHFESIPGLFRWALERESQKINEEIRAQETPEKAMRYFFLIALNAAPYIEKAIQGSYRDEFDHILFQYIYHFLEEWIAEDKLYANKSVLELNLTIRYHSYAIIGLIRNWNEKDMKNMDQIIHTVCLMIEGKSACLR